MNKRGSVLAHVLICVVILYIIAVYSLRSSLSAKMVQARSRSKAQASSLAEGARAQALSCLRENGFPAASCDEPLPSCLPATIGTPPAAVAFRASGDYAANRFCKLAIDVTLPGE
jgi:Tfp pilus assembly protein PilX